MSLRTQVLRHSVFSYASTYLKPLELAYVLPHGTVLKRMRATPKEAKYIVWFLMRMDIYATYDEETGFLWVRL
jgi:hypothetical protein